MTKNEQLKDLQQIPGVGKSIANDLWDINPFCSYPGIKWILSRD